MKNVIIAVDESASAQDRKKEIKLLSLGVRKNLRESGFDVVEYRFSDEVICGWGSDKDFLSGKFDRNSGGCGFGYLVEKISDGASPIIIITDECLGDEAFSGQAYLVCVARSNATRYGGYPSRSMLKTSFGISYTLVPPAINDFVLPTKIISG